MTALIEFRSLLKVFVGRSFGKGFPNDRLRTVQTVAGKVLENVGRITSAAAEIGRDKVAIVIKDR